MICQKEVTGEEHLVEEQWKTLAGINTSGKNLSVVMALIRKNIGLEEQKDIEYMV